MGGPAVAGLGPLLFLPCRSGRRRRRRVQHYPGSGALALWKGVASDRAGAPSRLLSLGRLRGGDGRCRLRGLLSRRRFRAIEQLRSWSAWAGSVAWPVTPSAPL